MSTGTASYYSRWLEDHRHCVPYLYRMDCSRLKTRRWQRCVLYWPTFGAISFSSSLSLKAFMDAKTGSSTRRLNWVSKRNERSRRAFLLCREHQVHSSFPSLRAPSPCTKLPLLEKSVEFRASQTENLAFLHKPLLRSHLTTTRKCPESPKHIENKRTGWRRFRYQSSPCPSHKSNNTTCNMCNNQ